MTDACAGPANDARVQIHIYFGPFRLASPWVEVRRQIAEPDRDGIRPFPAPTRSDLPSHRAGYSRLSEPVTGQIATLSWRNGLIRYTLSKYERSFIDLAGSYEDYLMKFSSKTRSTLKRKIRKLTELSGGKLDFRCYSAPHEFEEFHRLGLEVSRRTYQHRLFGKGLPEDGRFVREVLALAAVDRIRAFLLFHEGRPISYLYCPIEKDRLIYGFLGYLPEYAPYSPGTVLQCLAMERIFAEKKFSLFDFTAGEGEHKRMFSTFGVQCCDALYLKPSPRNIDLITLHLTARLSSELITKGLGRLGLRQRIRKLFHAGA